MFITQGVAMKKKLLSVILAVGLFSGAAAVQAGYVVYNQDTEGFAFDHVNDVVTVTFWVDNALDNSGVVLWTDTWATGSFDPFLVVWDSAGNFLAWNDDRSVGIGDSFINLGYLADGMYQFSIGNSPNRHAGNNLADGFVGAPTFITGLHPDRSFGDWTVHVNGIQAVPEPETWAMLLAGLGIVGAVARRRK